MTGEASGSTVAAPAREDGLKVSQFDAIPALSHEPKAEKTAITLEQYEAILEHARTTPEELARRRRQAKPIPQILPREIIVQRERAELSALKPAPTHSRVSRDLLAVLPAMAVSALVSGWLVWVWK